MATRSESANREIEELLQFLYLMPVSIARFGENGEVELANPKLVALLYDLGIDAGRADGPMILDALSPGLAQTWRESAGRVGEVMPPLTCAPPRVQGPALHLLLRLVRPDRRCTMLAIEDVTTTVEQLQRIQELFRVSEEQRRALAIFRDDAEAEAELARFLLSRLSKIELLAATGVDYYWVPAETFSGDLIAVARSSAGDHYGLLADATGHGLAAAINLIPLTTAFYAMAAKGFNLATICRQINDVVKGYSPADRFVAVTLARFCPREQYVEIVNAGNPPALLLNHERSIVREFASGSVALGILDRRRFEPEVGVCRLRGDELLVMFSDGLVEACNKAGEPFGREGIDDALRSAPANEAVVHTLRALLEEHCAGVTPTDDVTLLAMAASPTGPDESTAAPPASALTSVRVVKDFPEWPDDDSHWQVSAAFSSRELRRVEVVPVLADLLRTLGLGHGVEARFFTLLGELFSNALDHGLLGLNSQMKEGFDGLRHYLALRKERLAALNEGKITVQIDHWHQGPGAGRLRMAVHDSGPGFEHKYYLRLLFGEEADDSIVPRMGRGIPLLLTLCDHVRFSERGNEVAVEFSYP